MSHPTQRDVSQTTAAPSESSSLPASRRPPSRRPPSQESSFFQRTHRPEDPLGGDKPTAQPEHVDVETTASPITQLLNFQISAEETLAQTVQSRDIDDILKEVLEEEREKAGRARALSAGNTHHQAGADLGVNKKNNNKWVELSKCTFSVCCTQFLHS